MKAKTEACNMPKDLSRGIVKVKFVLSSKDIVAQSIISFIAFAYSLKVRLDTLQVFANRPNFVCE